MSLYNCVNIMNMQFDFNIRHHHKEIYFLRAVWLRDSIIWSKRNINWLYSSLISNFHDLRKCFEAGVFKLICICHKGVKAGRAFTFGSSSEIKLNFDVQIGIK